MGKLENQSPLSGEQRRRFMKSLLQDLRALEKMLDDGLLQSDVRRIGAEQEFFLVDEAGRPAGRVMDLLATLGDAHFTTELGVFNVELNLDPMPYGGDCLSRMQSQIERSLAKAWEAARGLGCDIVLTGILPTVSKSDLGLENMTPIPRYHLLNEALTGLRGGWYEFRIKGVDELLVRHDNVMLEACNTSFQVHFQVGPREFPFLYNVAQVAAAPVLAASTNSPLLFGQRLWSETRIALFEQAVDTRIPGEHLRERPARVSFGSDWVHESVMDLFKEDISRYRTLIGLDMDEDPFETLQKGGTPQLKALRLHNGTIYRWNRACYGITEGQPHLRIECRILPSGPTPADEVANAAFWFGLIGGLVEEYGDVRRVMEFGDAKSNFFAAGRFGLGAQFTWMRGATVPAKELICQELIPLARAGLKRGEIATEDIDRYLGIIEERVTTGRTGSQWMLQSYAGMKTHGVPGQRLGALVKAMIERQKEGQPVHRWPPATIADAGGWKNHYLRVEQFMITNMITVNEDDPVDLVAHLMDWGRIRHVPVEDAEHRLLGLVSYRQILGVFARGVHENRSSGPLPVAAIMKRDLITVSPETETLTAIELMRTHRIGCLPVIKDGRLVGVVTEDEFMGIAAELLAQKLKE